MDRKENCGLNVTYSSNPTQMDSTEMKALLHSAI